MPPLVWWGERDQSGRMTEHDRLLVLALREYESDLCECGHPRSHTMSPEHDPLDPAAAAVYQAGAPYRCFACTELARAQKTHADQLGEKNQDLMSGLKFGVELVQRRPSVAAQ